MSDYFLLKFGHLLLFVYWLGGDLGTFYSSKFVADPELSAEARRTAAKIMLGVDQAPRICMTLILPFGLHLAHKLGIFEVDFSVVIAAWILGIAWLLMVLVLHFDTTSAYIPALNRFDFWFRVLLVGGVAAIAAYALIFNKIFTADWAAIKLLVFAAVVASGLMIRVHLNSFAPAFQELMTDGASDAVNQTISDSIKRSKPYVYAIWFGLLVNAALGLHLI